LSPKTRDLYISVVKYGREQSTENFDRFPEDVEDGPNSSP